MCSKRRDSNGSSRRKKEEASAAKQAEEIEKLMKELDRDISSMLADDLDSYDHNADKKEYLPEEEAAEAKQASIFWLLSVRHEAVWVKVRWNWFSDWSGSLHLCFEGRVPMCIIPKADFHFRLYYK